MAKQMGSKYLSLSPSSPSWFHCGFKGFLIVTITTIVVMVIASVAVYHRFGHVTVSRERYSYSVSGINMTYIEIDHELVPRKIENINDMSPMPEHPGRNSAKPWPPEYMKYTMKKYPVSKRKVQELILEIEKNKTSTQEEFNKFQKNYDLENDQPSTVSETVIRMSQLKSVIGTEGKVYYDGDWGLMSAVLTCYNNHWTLRTGPEDWWTVVIRRIVQSMDDHGEEPHVREFFVEHEGKKQLNINVGPSLSNVNYNWLFTQFSDGIRENIKIPGYVDMIENDFSSSTDEQIMISKVMLMSSLKNYFEFGFQTACGIPGIEMKGTEKDWGKLVDKINSLEKLLAPINKYLHITKWFNSAKIVFNNLLNTYKGQPNIEWWVQILSWNAEWGSGARSHWSGWFPEFVGADSRPGKFVHFPSDLVTVPLHIADKNNYPPVEDDGILVAGILGFNVMEGERAPIVEPSYAWSLLLPEDSPVADRLKGSLNVNSSKNQPDPPQNSSKKQPDPPRHLQYVLLSPSSVLLSWDPVNPPSGQPLKAYSIRYKEVDSNAMDHHSISQNSSHLLERLKPGTNYTAQVRAYSNHASEPSEPIYFTTRENEDK